MSIFSLVSGYSWVGGGGENPYGSPYPDRMTINVAGNAGVGYGVGGGSAANGVSQSARASGAGAPGFIRVREFYTQVGLQSGAPGWEVVATVTPVSGAAHVPFTGLAAYRRLRFSGWLRPVTDADNLVLHTSINDGGAWQVGASDYFYMVLNNSQTVVSAASVTATGLGMNSGASIGNAAAECIYFTGEIIDLNNAAIRTMIRTDSYFFDPNTAARTTVSNGHRTTPEANNAFRLMFNGGNIAAGFVLLEGWKG
jgi:hypothetical protein